MLLVPCCPHSLHTHQLGCEACCFAAHTQSIILLPAFSVLRTRAQPNLFSMGAAGHGHPPQLFAKRSRSLQVKVKLNLHGIVGIESVQQVEEEEFEETIFKPASTVKVCLMLPPLMARVLQSRLVSACERLQGFASMQRVRTRCDGADCPGKQPAA